MGDPEQGTYRMNLTSLSEFNRIEYQSTTTNKKYFDSYERLDAVDLIVIALHAQSLKMYNVAVEFAREAMKLIPKEQSDLQYQKSPENFDPIFRKDFLPFSRIFPNVALFFCQFSTFLNLFPNFFVTSEDGEGDFP